jgi:autotransporter-associated beta strand protein
MGGFIYVGPGVTISTNGGRIVLAGQTDTNSDGIPDGYAYNVRTNDRAGVQLGPIGGLGSSINLLSGGGDINIWGYTGGSSPYPGIATQKSFKIDSGTGTITMNGGSNTGHGFELAYGVAADYVITSASTSSRAIIIAATTNVAGYSGGIFALHGGNYLIQSTASTGGGIEINGTQLNASGNALYFSGSGVETAYLLSRNGAITINATGGSNGIGSERRLVLGSHSGVTVNGVASGVSSSNANITLTANTSFFGTATSVLTSGSLSILSQGASFTSAQTLSNWTFASGLSGFTFGKVGNTSDLNMNSTLSADGAISFNGGAISLIGSLTTTNTTTGNISFVTTGLSGSGNMTLANGRSLSITQSGTSNYLGIIDGSSVSLTKAGIGRLNLLAANTYTGGTIVSAGSLGLYHNSSAGTGEISFANNTTLLLGRAVTTIANNLSLTGTVTVDLDMAVDYLLVGGGGGGGGIISGGGGGGGVVAGTSDLSGSLSVTVGTGGLGGIGWNYAARYGTSGASSVIGSLTALGGGFGGGYEEQSPQYSAIGAWGSGGGYGPAANPGLSAYANDANSSTF